jgi:hypothetical protein
MATKEEIGHLAMILSDCLFEAIGYVLSPPLSKDLAMRVLAEAHSVGFEIEIGDHAENTG